MKKVRMVFASTSAGKIKEVKLLIEQAGVEVELLGLRDIGFTDEIIEDGGSFEANAEIKARAVFERTGLICFADDSGLCVDWLGGAPGVDTAYYGGDILEELKNVPDGQRGAVAVCVIYCVVSREECFCVRGECAGIITRERVGESGFGFDPIFYYPPEGRTFAQMTSEEKSKFSHRGRAVELFAEKIVKYIN